MKKEYRDLEMKVLRKLRESVENSNYESKHIQEKAIKVNVFGYTELSIVNDTLTFLDNNGMQYSIWADANLEDLIDIINA